MSSSNAASLDFDAVPPAVRRVCQRLQQTGKEAYVVGGSVRDLLLGRTVADWDVTTSARPKQVQRLFDKTIATGIKHGTITVLAAPELPVEVTTYRGEGAYSDGRRPDTVHFLDDLQADLERRDFTINAIALDPVARMLRDPLDGRADLARRLVRAVGDPARRFAEDGLRPLRAIRFAAVLQFRVDADTLAAIGPALDTFRQVSVERVREELFKLLLAPRPSEGIELLREAGLLQLILPELQRCIGVPLGTGRQDAYRHGLAVCDALPADAVARLAGLLHDIGRCGGDVPDSDPPADHADLGSARCREIAQRLRLATAQRERICQLVAHHRVDDSVTEGADLRRFLRRIGPARWPDLAQLRRADLAVGVDAAARLGRFELFCGRVERELAAAPVLDVSGLCLGGKDVMEHLGRPPGPYVGRVLRALLEQVIEQPSLNQRDQLLALVDGVVSAADAGR